MKVKSYVLFWLLFTVTASTCFAQTKQLKFNLIKGADEITFGKINCVMRDRHGFVWLSDQINGCLFRYDGSHVTKYSFDPNNPNSLGGNYPECLYEDADGIIWIGFYGMGLDRFDPGTNTFTHFKHDKNDPASLADNFVSAVSVDHLGNVWVGTAAGLDLLDKKTGNFRHFKNDPKNPKSLSSDDVRAIYEDKEGTLWVGTGIPFVNDQKGGLNKFNRETSDFTVYLNEPKNQKSIINNKVRAIFEDSKGNFWVGTAGDGLHLMNRQTGEFQRLVYDPNKPDKLSRLPSGNYDDHITFITEDITGGIWIGTMNNGITRYDLTTQKVTRLGSTGHKSSDFPESSFWAVCATPEGQVWITTQSARLYRIELFNNFIPHFELQNKSRVNCMLEDSDGTLWFGTSNGLVRKDLKSTKETAFLDYSQKQENFSTNIITSIIEDHEGYLWLCTANGLVRFDKKKGTMIRYLFDPALKRGFSDNSLLAIYEDADFNFWLGSFGNGLLLFDRKTEKITRHLTSLTKADKSAYAYVGKILSDKDQNLWILYGQGNGLVYFNPKNKQFKTYLNSIIGTSDIHLDNNNLLWVCSSPGIILLDPKSNDYTALHRDNASLYINNAQSIYPDQDRNMWVTGDGGLYKINRTRNNMISFDENNGISLNINIRCLYSTKSGKIYVGTDKGYYAFDPKKLETFRDTATIYCTNFWLNGELQIPKSNGIIKEPVLAMDRLDLKYFQNSFSFSFAAIDFRNDDEEKILYTLENYDKEWRQTKGEEKIYYFNVPPGKYTLKIKTTNSVSGITSEKSIQIIITPPWWKTLWAYMIFTGLFFASIWGFIKYQSRKIISENRILEQKVASRTAEVVSQKEEIENTLVKLKSTQAQLIQSEKMASLGELTAGIAHEIQNPLNFVNNFSEVSAELIVDMVDEVDDGNYDDVKAIAMDVQQNLEKINHHGKRASSIVKGMLEHSRTSTGQKELTDMNALCDEYLRLSYHGLRAKDKDFNATMETHFDPNLPKIDIIPQDIGRVILNLINNAFYALSEKSKVESQKSGSGYEPTVSITTQLIANSQQLTANTPTTQQPNSLIISIKDNGSGIPTHIKDKIFQPFFTTKPTGQGTGLGLSLAYDIVKAHGGELKVETKEGEGSIFIVKLPTA